MATESSPMLDRRTTKSRAVIFGAIRSIGHGEVAKACGVSESTFSEWLQKYGDRIALILTAIGHKPVPLGVECHTPEYVKTLRHYASIGIAIDPDEIPSDKQTLDFGE